MDNIFSELKKLLESAILLGLKFLCLGVIIQLLIDDKILLFSINNDSFLGVLPVPSIIVPFSIRVFSSIFLTSRALYYQF